MKFIKQLLCPIFHGHQYVTIERKQEKLGKYKIKVKNKTITKNVTVFGKVEQCRKCDKRIIGIYEFYE